MTSFDRINHTFINISAIFLHGGIWVCYKNVHVIMPEETTDLHLYNKLIWLTQMYQKGLIRWSRSHIHVSFFEYTKLILIWTYPHPELHTQDIQEPQLVQSEILYSFLYLVLHVTYISKTLWWIFTVHHMFRISFYIM